MPALSLIAAARRRLSSQSGITILYVVAVLLLAAAVGTALMKMSNVEVTSAGDFTGVTSAAMTANSAMLAVESYFADNEAAATAKLNAFIESSTKNPIDLIGTATQPDSVNGSQKYWARIVGFDAVNWIVAIEAIGWGKGGSRKSVTGYFRLNQVITTTPSVVPTNALHLSGGNQTATACKIEVHGNTFVRVPFSGGGTANERFHAHGKFWMSATVPSGASSASVEMDGLRFDDDAYFGRPVTITGNWSSTGGGFYGKVFFDGDVIFNTGNCVPLHGETWFNGNFSGATDDWSRHLHWPLSPTGGVHGVSSKSYTNGFINSGASINHGGSYPWVAPQLQATPYLPASCISFNGATDPDEVSLNLPAAAVAKAQDSPSGFVSNAIIQAMCTGSTSSQKYLDFTVINATGWESSNGQPDVAISEKAIVRISSFASRNGDGTSSGAIKTTADGGPVLVIIDIGAGNTGILDLGAPFRGMIYVKSGNPTIRTNSGSNTSLVGCFYAAPGTCPTIGGFGGGDATFTWNGGIVSELAGLGVFGVANNAGTITDYANITLRGMKN